MTTQRAALPRIVTAYAAYAFLFDAMLAYAVYTALFELEGLTVAEIGILLAFWSASAIVLELPSGALSDRFDRRLLLVAAPLAKALTFVCWGLAQGDFWLYGLGFLFWSIGQSLYSGTGEALLYEHMDAAGRADEYDRALGRAAAAEAAGIGTGTLLGGFVALAGMDWTLWLSIPPLLACAIVALRLADIRRGPAAADEEADRAPSTAYLDHFRQAFAEFRGQADLRAIALYIALGMITFEILEEFDQLYYLAVGLPVWLWGVVGAAVLWAQAAMNAQAHRLSGHPALAWALPLVAGLLLVAAAIGAHPGFTLLLVAAYLVVAPVNVLAHARFQQVMAGGSRATTTSALVVAQNIVGIVATLGFGLAGQALGILPAYALAGLAMVPVALWVRRAQRRGARLLA